MDDREQLIRWNQRINTVDQIDTAINHYKQLVDQIEENEQRLLNEIKVAKERMMASISAGSKLAVLKDHFGQIMLALDSGEFDTDMILDEAHQVLSDATGFASSELNFDLTLIQISKMIGEISSIQLKPASSLVSLGTLSGTNPLNLKTPRRGRGRGRLLTRESVETASSVASLTSSLSEHELRCQFADLPSLEAEPPTNELSHCSDESFARKVTRPDDEAKPKSPLIQLPRTFQLQQQQQEKLIELKTTKFKLDNVAYQLDELEPCHADLNRPMGIAARPDASFIVADTFNNGVHIHDASLKRVSSLNAQFKSPTSVTCATGGVVFIKDNNSIKQFTNNQLDMSFGESVNFDKSAGAMLYNDQIRTIVNDYQIATFGLESGQLVSKTPINWAEHLDRRPRIRFARNYNDMLYLADMANNCVLLVDFNGDIKHIAGTGSGRSKSQFAQPAGLTIDAVGNFIIADSKNNRFLHFSATGEPRGELRLKTAVKRPADCYLSDAGVFYTCVLGGAVRRFNLIKSSLLHS